MTTQEIAAKAAKELSRVMISATANHYMRIAQMYGNNDTLTKQQCEYKQMSAKIAFAHEMGNRINAMTDVWNLFDRISMDSIEEEHETISRLMDIDNLLADITTINLVGITYRQVQEIRKMEQQIEENAMAVWCAFDAIATA